MAAMRRSGGCNCGKVRLELRGEPIRVGLCHCLTCRRETGSAFMAFAIWEAGAVTVTGTTASWKDTTDQRHFCPGCGSSLFGTSNEDNEIEVRIGALDEAPSGLAPDYELWVPRREHWLPERPGTAQHARNRRT
jgi:hypothetical protein